MQDRARGTRPATAPDPLVAWLEKPGCPARVTLGSALEAMGGMGFGRLLLILTLPNVLVVPSVPPFPFLCGLPAMLLSVQMALGRPRASLPGWAERLSLRRDQALKIARFAAVLGRVARPRRWNWMRGRIARALLGTLVLFLTAVICLPLLGLNFLPAIGLAVLILGMAEEDGAITAAGVGLSFMGFAAMIAIIHLALIAVSGASGVQPSPEMEAFGEQLRALLP